MTCTQYFIIDAFKERYILFYVFSLFSYALHAAKLRIYQSS